jgi:hypothetical protein
MISVSASRSAIIFYIHWVKEELGRNGRVRIIFISLRLDEEYQLVLLDKIFTLAIKLVSTMQLKLCRAEEVDARL